MEIKLPAIRAKIGDWVYYISRMRFSEISDYVKKIDDELHKSEVLKQEIQRALTSNYLKIKEYILTTDERFLGSLVLAVYDGNPNWIEMRIEYDEQEIYEVGFLVLSKAEKIFPVDGQHRVEGIKAALEENKDLAEEIMPVVFIGHNTTDAGMQRTRRLFTTLNRYAKPVNLDDIIALDEDDVVAIATRELIEDYILFKDNKVIKSKQKAMSDGNKDAFTSIISLYHANLDIFKSYFNRKYNELPTKSRIEKFLKVRPNEETIKDYLHYLTGFWNSVIKYVPDIISFTNGENKEEYVRNSIDGGNLLFRPIGLEAFSKAVSTISLKSDYSIKQILVSFSQKKLFYLSLPLWKNVLWNSSTKRMIMNKNITSQIFIYAFDKTLLSNKSVQRLALDLKSLWNMEDKVNDEVLIELDSRISSQ